MLPIGLGTLLGLMNIYDVLFRFQSEDSLYRPLREEEKQNKIFTLRSSLTFSFEIVSKDWCHVVPCSSSHIFPSMLSV